MRVSQLGLSSLFVELNNIMQRYTAGQFATEARSKEHIKPATLERSADIGNARPNCNCPSRPTNLNLTQRADSPARCGSKTRLR
jgi:hypothetical protein